MGTKLLIAGHGKKPDGSIDPGAKGLIAKGEHRYFKENFLPAVKRHLPDGADVVIYSERNVLHYGDIVALANKYGKDTEVIELHFDASDSPKATGGHVIVHEDFEPDKLDLAIRDYLKAFMGIRYEHKGHKGIDGRPGSELGNVRRTAAAGVNYRLVEFGFGTNSHDANIMVNEVDRFAKGFVKAILGKTKENDAPSKPKEGVTHTVKKGDTLWDIARKYGTTVTKLKANNPRVGDLIRPGQQIFIGKVRSYTVKKGDTLSGIGAKLGVKWQDIATKNSIKSPYIIQPGDKLKY